ncbi:hypothetical protein M2281_002550 [Mesorhizobium soli]|nr:hypothetical protein [Mesorhizobium soli]
MINQFHPSYRWARQETIKLSAAMQVNWFGNAMRD